MCEGSHAFTPCISICMHICFSDTSWNHRSRTLLIRHCDERIRRSFVLIPGILTALVHHIMSWFHNSYQLIMCVLNKRDRERIWRCLQSIWTSGRGVGMYSTWSWPGTRKFTRRTSRDSTHVSNKPTGKFRDTWSYNGLSVIAWWSRELRHMTARGNCCAACDLLV